MVILKTNKLIEAIEVFRELDAEMPPQAILTFLLVAENDGISMTELTEAVGNSQPACSRNVGYLGEINRKHEPGFGLVRTVRDPLERRRNLVYVTAKGRKLYSKVMGKL